MIDKVNFLAQLTALGFAPADLLNPNRYRKAFPDLRAELIADFDAEKLIYPEAQGLTIAPLLPTSSRPKMPWCLSACTGC